MSVTFSYNFLLSFCVSLSAGQGMCMHVFRHVTVSGLTPSVLSQLLKHISVTNRSAAHPVSYSVPTITFLAYACSLPIRWNLHTI